MNGGQTKDVFVHYFNAGLTKKGIFLRGDWRDVRGIELKKKTNYVFEGTTQILCNFV